MFAYCKEITKNQIPFAFWLQGILKESNSWLKRTPPDSVSDNVGGNIQINEIQN